MEREGVCMCQGVCSQLCGVADGDREVGVAEEDLP